MDDLQRIDELVHEYNAVELEQRDRLEKLYDLIDARSGWRRVVFGPGKAWANCWNQERHDLTIAKLVDGAISQISLIEPGEADALEYPETIHRTYGPKKNINFKEQVFR